MDIALHGRVVRQEGEVAAGSVFPQSGSRLVTASARVIFSTPPPPFSSPGPYLWDGSRHVQNGFFLPSYSYLEITSQMCLLGDSKSSQGSSKIKAQERKRLRSLRKQGSGVIWKRCALAFGFCSSSRWPTTWLGVIELCSSVLPLFCMFFFCCLSD